MHSCNLHVSRSVSCNWRTQLVSSPWLNFLVNTRVNWPLYDRNSADFSFCQRHRWDFQTSTTCFRFRTRWIHGSFRYTMTPRKSLRAANGADRLSSLRAFRIVSGARFSRRKYMFCCRQNLLIRTSRHAISRDCALQHFFRELNWPNILCDVKNCKK